MKIRSAIEAAGKKFRTKNISKRVRNIVISPIKEMSMLADEWREKTHVDIISFGQGIPWWDTPQNIKWGIKKSLNKVDTAKYTLEPGITELRELIAKQLQASKNIRRIEAKKEIMVTVGCQEAIGCALATLIDQDDEILLLEPGFASHIEQILQFGGKPVYVPLKIEKSRGHESAAGAFQPTLSWRFDINECENRITKKTKAILFSNPSNPTGMVLSAKEISDIAKLALKHDLIIITDETYDFLTYDETKHISPASLKKLRGRVILCGSFSKKYAMTGYRIGFAYADEGLIYHMLKVHDALAICAPAISQKAAITALNGPQTSVQEGIERFKAQRAMMCLELDTMSHIFEYAKPMGAYYIMVKIKRLNISSFKLALKILREANIIVIPGAAFGPTGEGFIRFSFAGKPENIRRGFIRLKKWARKWAASGHKL